MIRRRWQRAERDVAKAEGGKTVVASGSQWHSKGDVSSKTHLIQVKSTEKKQYPLKLAELQQIEDQASAVNKDAKFVIEFLTSTGRVRYAVTREWTS